MPEKVISRLSEDLLKLGVIDPPHHGYRERLWSFLARPGIPKNVADERLKMYLEVQNQYLGKTVVRTHEPNGDRGVVEFFTTAAVNPAATSFNRECNSFFCASVKWSRSSRKVHPVNLLQIVEDAST